MEVRTQEQVISETKDFAKIYCALRYKQEVELSNLKDSFKEEMKNYVDDLRENCISKQKLDFHRVVYEKGLLARDTIDPKEIKKTATELSEIFYNSILSDFDNMETNCADYYKEKYIKYKQDILTYYVRYIETQEDVRKLKQRHSEKLSQLNEEIYLSGTPLFIIRHIYKCLKNDLSTKKISPSEFDHCAMLYNSLKDELIEQSETIEKEDRIDLKAIKTIQITREEAIMRISSVIELIETEQFDILKEQAKQDTFIFAIDYVDRYNKLLYSYNRYYVSRLGEELEYWSNAELCKVMNLQGFRYAQREEYLI